MGQHASTQASHSAPGGGGVSGGGGGPSWLGSLGQSLSSQSLVATFQPVGSSSSLSSLSSSDEEQEAIKVRRVYLDLSSRGLRRLVPPPHELEEFLRPMAGGCAEFIYLEALSLAHNQLTELGEDLLQIKHLPLLMELDLSHNRLEAFDEGANSLTRAHHVHVPMSHMCARDARGLWGNADVCELMATLERLNLAQNRLTYLPSNLYLLHNLRELNLAHNDIVYLPEELSQLPQLHYLNLSANNLYALPDSCCKLRSLKTLILSNNQLELLSPRLSDLSQLTWLDISWNQLDSFPPSLPSSLKKLYAGNNRIRTIEGDVIRRLQNLKELSLPCNKLTRLPREMLQLIDVLKILDIEDNVLSDRDSHTQQVLAAFTKARSTTCQLFADTNLHQNRHLSPL